MLIGGWGARQWLGLALAHGLPFEGDAVGVVHQPVEDGIGQRWIADERMPMLDGELAGDERGALAIAVIEQFQEVMPCLGVESSQAPSSSSNGSVLAMLRMSLGKPPSVWARRQLLEQPRRV